MAQCRAGHCFVAKPRQYEAKPDDEMCAIAASVLGQSFMLAAKTEKQRHGLPAGVQTSPATAMQRVAKKRTMASKLPERHFTQPTDPWTHNCYLICMMKTPNAAHMLSNLPGPDCNAHAVAHTTMPSI